MLDEASTLSQSSRPFGEDRIGRREFDAFAGITTKIAAV
jgi:hypothetical protein